MVTESNSFRVSYGIYLDYIRHYRYKKSWGYRAVIFTTLGALLTLAIYFQLAFHTSRAIGTLVIAGALAFYYFIILDLLFPIWGFWSARKRGAYAHTCRVRLNENGVEAVSEDGEIKKPWKSIDCVISTPRNIFIYFNKSAAFLIPKTAFEAVEDAQIFFQTATDFLARSKNH